jgi:hypothetical protein
VPTRTDPLLHEEVLLRLRAFAERRPAEERLLLSVADAVALWEHVARTELDLDAWSAIATRRGYALVELQEDRDALAARLAARMEDLRDERVRALEAERERAVVAREAAGVDAANARAELSRAYAESEDLRERLTEVVAVATGTTPASRP